MPRAAFAVAPIKSLRAFFVTVFPHFRVICE